MATMIIHLMLSITVTKQVTIHYDTMKECEAASIAIVKTLDRLNENETLGYSWQCSPAKVVK